MTPLQTSIHRVLDDCSDGLDVKAIARRIPTGVGATYNALSSMVERGDVVRDSSQKPHMYRIVRPRGNTIDQWSAAEELITAGRSFREVARATGIPKTTLTADGRLRDMRQAVDPSFESAKTVRHYDRTVSCTIEPASAMMDEIDWRIWRLLSDVYTLSERDSARLETILSNALKHVTEKETEGVVSADADQARA